MNTEEQRMYAEIYLRHSSHMKALKRMVLDEMLPLNSKGREKLAMGEKEPETANVLERDEEQTSEKTE